MLTWLKSMIKPQHRILEISSKVFALERLAVDRSSRAYFLIGQHGNYLFGTWDNGDNFSSFLKAGGGIKYQFLTLADPSWQKNCETLFQRFGAQLIVPPSLEDLVKDWSLPKIKLANLLATDLVIEQLTANPQEAVRIQFYQQTLTFHIQDGALILAKAPFLKS